MNIHEGSYVLVNILTCAFSALRLSTPTVELCWEQEAHCPPHLIHTNKSVDSERHRFMQFTQEWCTPTYLYFTVLWCESKAHVFILTLYSPFFWPGHSGLTPAQSEFNFLSTARTLELYGVELHYARVSESELFYCVSTHNLYATNRDNQWNGKAPVWL